MTTTTDHAGRPYAKLSTIRPGTLLQVDGDWSCLPVGAIREVFNEDGAGNSQLCIHCSDGLHMLEGQLQDDGDTLVGIHNLTPADLAVILEPFATLPSEGTEDLPDDAPVLVNIAKGRVTAHHLSLGDLRRLADIIHVLTTELE